MKHRFLLIISLFVGINLNCTEKKDQPVYSPTSDRARSFTVKVDEIIHERTEYYSDKKSMLEAITNIYQNLPEYKDFSDGEKKYLEIYVKEKINMVFGKRFIKVI